MPIIGRMEFKWGDRNIVQKIVYLCLQKTVDFTRRQNSIIVVMERKIVKEYFWPEGVNDDKALYEDELGWPATLQRDAQSDYSETIFRYVVEIVGFNLLFYWVEDGNFYSIEVEKSPIEVRRIHRNEHWDGKCEFLKAGSECGPNTASPGDVIATFDESVSLWDKLIINGKHLSEILTNSAIITWD